MLKRITPIGPVSDLQKSMRFFCEVLGFHVGFESEGYAYVRRDDVGIRLVKAAPGVDIHAPSRELSCYIDVENLDEVYQAMKPNLDLLPGNRVRAPFDQHNGQREVHVIDEDSLLMFFGEPIRE